MSMKIGQRVYVNVDGSEVSGTLLDIHEDDGETLYEVELWDGSRVWTHQILV